MNILYMNAMFFSSRSGRRTEPGTGHAGSTVEETSGGNTAGGTLYIKYKLMKPFI